MYLTKAMGRWCGIILCLIALSFGAGILLDGWNVHSSIYLFPKLVQRDRIVLEIFLSSFIILVGIVISLVAKPLKRRSKIAKVLLIILLCLAFLVSTTSTSAFMFCQSYTDDINEYLRFDTNSELVEKTRVFMPTKFDINGYLSDGAQIEYSYLFSYPFLTEAYEYKVELMLNFSNNSERFEELCEDVFDGVNGTILEEDGVYQFTYTEEALINSEPVLLTHIIATNSNTKVIVYTAELEIV